MILSGNVTALVYSTIPIANCKLIYSAMIILGFLSYHDGYLKIPNKELMREFEAMDSTFQYLSKIGYSTIKPEDYEKMVNDIKVKQTKLNTEK